MNWINVKENHFADIRHDEPTGSFAWESDLIDEPFMVAIPTKEGWCIQQVVLINDIGLQCHTDDDGPTYFGWSMIDVTHWMKIEPPITINRSKN